MVPIYRRLHVGGLGWKIEKQRRCRNKLDWNPAKQHVHPLHDGFRPPKVSVRAAKYLANSKNRALNLPCAKDSPQPRPASPMTIIQCEPRKHAAAILAIFNEAIVNSTALYDYKPRTADMIQAWFEAKAKGNFPVIGAQADDGELMGFASFGTFRAWPAYKYSVEHSVYVDERYRGRGVGRRLLEETIEAARKQDYHVLIGGIDAANKPSIALHERLGFTHCGTIRQTGFKFGRWLDLSFYQLILDTPLHPVDGMTP